MRITALAPLVGLALAAHANQAPKEIEIVGPTFSLVFREGWTATPTSDTNVLAAAHMTGSTVQMRGAKARPGTDLAAVEDSLYAGLRKQLTATIEPEERHLGKRVWKMSEWKSSQAPGSRARWFVLKEDDYLFLAILTYSTNPDLCCVVTADADAAMATLKITAPAVAVRPRPGGYRTLGSLPSPAPRDLLGRSQSGPNPWAWATSNMR